MTSKKTYKILYNCRNAQSRALQMEQIKQLAERYNLEIIFSDIETIKRKEQLEKENQELAEAIQLSNEYIAGFERIKADLMIENQKLAKENQELIKEKNATIILMRLMALDPNNIVESALILDKYKKAIEIIKGMDIWLNYDEEEFNGSIEINGYFEITKDQYDLLKEVLE